MFGPPMTIFGSVTDSAGPVAEGIDIEAFIGDKACGRGKTQFTGEGSGRVTVYYADVVSREQTGGCGAVGVEVRIKVGDRFAQQTTKWRQGPAQLDLTFGSATPAAIPTFTPTPTRTPAPGETAIPGTPTPRGTTPANQTPGGTATGTSESVTGTPGASATATATPTLRGGVSSSQPGGGGDGGDAGGFPVWAAVVAVLGGLALIGGGVGYLMARGRRHDDLAL